MMGGFQAPQAFGQASGKLVYHKVANQVPHTHTHRLQIMHLYVWVEYIDLVALMTHHTFFVLPRARTSVPAQQGSVLGSARGTRQPP